MSTYFVAYIYIFIVLDFLSVGWYLNGRCWSHSNCRAQLRIRGEKNVNGLPEDNRLRKR